MCCISATSADAATAPGAVNHTLWWFISKHRVCYEHYRCVGIVRVAEFGQTVPIFCLPGRSWHPPAQYVQQLQCPCFQLTCLSTERAFDIHAKWCAINGFSGFRAANSRFWIALRIQSKSYNFENFGIRSPWRPRHASSRTLKQLPTAAKLGFSSTQRNFANKSKQHIMQPCLNRMMT